VNGIAKTLMDQFEVDAKSYLNKIQPIQHNPVIPSPTREAMSPAENMLYNNLRNLHSSVEAVSELLDSKVMLNHFRRASAFDQAQVNLLFRIGYLSMALAPSIMLTDVMIKTDPKLAEETKTLIQHLFDTFTALMDTPQRHEQGKEDVIKLSLTEIHKS